MKRKTNKKSGIIAAVVGLSAVSLVSVGFASWIISAGDSAALNSSIQVDTVEDHRYMILNKTELLARNDTNANDVVFGAPSTREATNEWLKSDGAKIEKLSFTFDVIVDNMNSQKGDVSAELGFKTEAMGATYQAAVEKGVVAAKPTPVLGAITQINDAQSTYNGEYYRSVTVTFAWGTHFGGSNPYNFYNDGTKTAATHGDDAVEYLGYVETLSSVQFTLAITTSERA